MPDGTLVDMTVRDFLDEAGSREPAPGGGAVAALIASLGAVAAEMTARFTIGRRFRDVEPAVREHIARFESIRSECAALMDADKAAFQTVAAGYALPKSTPDQQAARKQAIQRALESAADVPENLIAVCLRALETLSRLADIANRQLAGDLGLAAVAIRAAALGAWLNVDGNLKGEAFSERRARAADDIYTIDKLSETVFERAQRMVRNGS